MKKVTPKQAASASVLDKWQLAVSAVLSDLRGGRITEAETRLDKLYASMQRAERR